MPFLPTSRRAVLQPLSEMFAFPWQGAVLVICLSVGAAVRMHPEVLRPLVHQVQMASVEIGR